MLLKQSNPEHAINAGMSPRALPPSDTGTHHDIPHLDPLDDVFGSDDPDDLAGPHRQDLAQHPSDIHRLQREHTTAGYRDGIATAKASSVQAGFDEGFGLGATIGLKAGRLLGLLEGIVGALRAHTSAAAAAGASEASKLLADARAELELQTLFSQAYWDVDGTWKYDVDQGEGVDDGAVLFSHVADAHPILRRWTATVDAQMTRWRLQEQLPLLQRRDGEQKPALEPTAQATAPVQSQGEAKAPSDALSW